MEPNEKNYRDDEPGVPEENNVSGVSPGEDESLTTKDDREENTSDNLTEKTDGTDTDAFDEVEKNCTTDEDDIAYVAERITGARHSIVSTAAPVRIRESRETVQMNSLVRMMEKSAEKKAAPREKKTKQTKTLYGIVAAAVVLALVLIFVIVAVNVSSDKNRPADLNIGEVNGDALTLPSDSETDSENKPNNETESAEPNDATEPTDANGEKPADENGVSEPETEPETERKPEPVEPKYSVVLDFYDRDDIEVSTEKITLESLLEQCEIVLAEGEVPSLSLESVIAADVTITIDKYEYKTESVSETIPFESHVTETDLIPRGEKRYTQYGEDGLTNKYYTVEYINGAENSRTYSHEEVVKYPVDAVYEEGVGGSFVGSDGVTYTYSHRRVVPATYYNLEGATYLGNMADETVIAVDPDNIPMGTRLYVKNDRYDFGVRVASDIGGHVDEWEVDIWLSASNPQFSSFSREGYVSDMEIYYID